MKFNARSTLKPARAVNVAKSRCVRDVVFIGGGLDATSNDVKQRDAWGRSSGVSMCIDTTFHDNYCENEKDEKFIFESQKAWRRIARGNL